MGIYQIVQDLLIRATYEKKQIPSFLLRQCRNVLLKISDPAVEINIEGEKIILPFSHDLPKYLAQYPLYMRNFSLLGKVVYEFYPNICAIDIGANVGDTLVFLRKYYSYPIICIEGNPAYLGYLERNCSQREGITICPYFVGKEGAIEGKLITEQGTARIDLTQKSDGLTSKSLQSIYDSQPFRNSPKFVKIDTDGFDLMIIRESLGFIEKYHPILFFEFDPFLFKKVELSKEKDIFELLENLGYTYGIEFDNLGKFLRKFSVKEEAKTQYISNKFKNSIGDIFSDIALFHFNDEEVFNKYLAEVTSKCI